MLHVIGMIFKILGILLLIVIGIIFLLLILVLFTPFCYKLEASKYGKITGKGKITWLFRLIKVEFEYLDGEFNQIIRIFGRKLKEYDYSKEDEDIPYAKEELKALEEEIEKEEVEVKKGISASEAIEQAEEPISVSLSESEVEEKKSEPIQINSKSKKKTKKKKRKQKRNKTNRLNELTNKTTTWREQIKEIYDFLTIPSIKILIKKNIKRSKRLIKKILPRRLSGNIHFGFDDPLYTGEVLALVSMFYALYYDRLFFEPDFEQPVFEGEIKLSGKIRISYFVSFLFKLSGNLLINKETRTLVMQKLRRK